MNRQLQQSLCGSRVPRRRFLQSAGCFGVAVMSSGWQHSGMAREPTGLLVGEGIAEITPPVDRGIELAGFHRVPGQERRVKGIRERSFVRALAFDWGGKKGVIVLADLLAVGKRAAAQIRAAVSGKTNIPGENIKICATHTHSMPSLIHLRQWGAFSEDYYRLVEERIVEAVSKAVADLAPARLRIGRSTVIGGNFNRTASFWKNEDSFDGTSTDAERWLDRHLHALVFERPGKSNFVWYHFCAHPVCYADELAGPDWPALVARRAEERWGISPGYLQGHIGDVNPGPGQPWRGEAEQVAAAVWAGLEAAVGAAVSLGVDRFDIREAVCELPLDVLRWRAWLAEYRQNPDKCTRGVWVDAPFAKEWFEANEGRQSVPDGLATPIAAWHLGPLKLLLHGSELYSFYGLWLRRHSGAEHALVIGYADDFVGYLTDPKAHVRVEYAAAVVPKILDLPPFQPNATWVLVEQLRELATSQQVSQV